MSQTTPESERTLRAWYELSLSRAQFYAEAATLTEERIGRIIELDLSRPAEGHARTLESIRRPARAKLPPIADVMTMTPDSEHKLQLLLMHRGHLLNADEPVVEREIPTAPEGTPREGWSDALVYDTKRKRPMLVEIKKGEATDPLSGVLFELLSHWSFHKRYGLRQLMEDTGFDVGDFDHAELTVLAPLNYFDETIRRSKTPERMNEVSVARKLISCLNRKYDLIVRFLAIDDDWPTQGVSFGIQEWQLHEHT